MHEHCDSSKEEDYKSRKKYFCRACGRPFIFKRALGNHLRYRCPSKKNAKNIKKKDYSPFAECEFECDCYDWNFIESIGTAKEEECFFSFSDDSFKSASENFDLEEFSRFIAFMDQQHTQKSPTNFSGLGSQEENLISDIKMNAENNIEQEDAQSLFANADLSYSIISGSLPSVTSQRSPGAKTGPRSLNTDTPLKNFRSGLTSSPLPIATSTPIKATLNGDDLRLVLIFGNGDEQLVIPAYPLAAFCVRLNMAITPTGTVSFPSYLSRQDILEAFSVLCRDSTTGSISDVDANNFLRMYTCSRYLISASLKNLCEKFLDDTYKAMGPIDLSPSKLEEFVKLQISKSPNSTRKGPDTHILSFVQKVLWQIAKKGREKMAEEGFFRLSNGISLILVDASKCSHFGEVDLSLYYDE